MNHFFSRLFGKKRAEIARQAGEVAGYIAALMPGEYLQSADYQCIVTPQSEGLFRVEINLDFSGEGVDFEITELESCYLLEAVFVRPPYLVDFVLRYREDGKTDAIVTKEHSHNICHRLYRGKADEFLLSETP